MKWHKAHQFTNVVVQVQKGIVHETLSSNVQDIDKRNTITPTLSDEGFHMIIVYDSIGYEFSILADKDFGWPVQNVGDISELDGYIPDDVNKTQITVRYTEDNRMVLDNVFFHKWPTFVG